MGYYASSCLVEEDTPSKNRVVGSERFSFDRAGLPASQLPESHQETTLIVTIIVSGRHSFWAMDTWQGTTSIPISLHKYLYSLDDPVSFVDPSGHNVLSLTVSTAILIGLVAYEARIILTTRHYDPSDPAAIKLCPGYRYWVDSGPHTIVEICDSKGGSTLYDWAGLYDGATWADDLVTILFRREVAATMRPRTTITASPESWNSISEGQAQLLRQAFNDGVELSKNGYLAYELVAMNSYQVPRRIVEHVLAYGTNPYGGPSTLPPSP